MTNILRTSVGCVGILFFTSIAEADVSVNINANNTYQTIDGFGTSQSADYTDWIRDMPEPQRTEVIDAAFSQGSGIGLTILRSQILPSMQPSPTTWNDAAADDADQVWLMKESLKRGPVKLIGSAWTPPGWMKASGSEYSSYCQGLSPKRLCNNTDNMCPAGLECIPDFEPLLALRYPDYAAFLSHYAKEYAQHHGLNIYALSPANEPNEATNYDSCSWNSAQVADFLGNHVYPTFVLNHVTTKIITPETSQWSLAETTSCNNSSCYMYDTYNNTYARNRVDIVAGHGYFGNLSQPFAIAQTYGKKVWQTETSMIHDPTTIEGALLWSEDIHNGLVNAQINAWVWWLLLGGFNLSNFAWLIDRDVSNPGNYWIRKAYYAIGNFSKFVRPGFVRISATANNSQVLVSAFKDQGTKQVVFVVINKSATGQTINLTKTGWGASTATPYVTSFTQNLERKPPVSLGDPLSVPGRSIVTYVAGANDTQVDLFWREASGSLAMWIMSPTGTVSSYSNPQSIEASWSFQGTGDFNGDGLRDVVWRNSATGNVAIWLMSSASILGYLDPGTEASAWSIRGVADLNADSISDIVWHNASTGYVRIWLMTPSGTISSVANPPTNAGGWTLHGLGDFNHDGKADLYWRWNSSNAVWLMNGGTVMAFPSVPQLSTDFVYQGIGDLNGDGTSDVLWRKASNGQLVAWLFSSNTVPSLTADLTGPSTEWAFQGLADANGDFVSDLVWRSSSTGNVAAWLMNANWSVNSFVNPGSATSTWTLQGYGRFN